MENQHRHIKGYRELSEADVALMNEIKAKGAELEELVGKMRSHVGAQFAAAGALREAGQTDEIARLERAEPHRWLALARTDFQSGLMALTRAVAQPTTF